MGVAYYPEVNPPIPGFKPDLAVGGKPIARALPLLDRWADERGVRTLYSFYSETLEESFSHIGEPVPTELIDGPHDTPIEWSDANEGLNTVRTLLDHLRSVAPGLLEFENRQGESCQIESSRVIEDLESLESVLRKAIQSGSKFRLRIDV
jgi:hypothetical protein